jgi:uncharacterized protein
MTRFWRWVMVLAAMCVCAALIGWSWRWATRPAVLSVAVGPPGFDDTQLAEAFSRLLAANKSSVRLSIVYTSGPIESVTKLTRGEVQLAITRTDIKAGDAARTVARLHSDPVVILATSPSGATKFTDLNGRAIGIIGPPEANNALLDTLRREYRATFRTVEVQPSASSISAALREQKLSALLFVVPVARSSRVADTWHAVRKASGTSFHFVPIEEAEAIAASAPAYEEGEISSGQFGGSPLLPPDDVTTLEVATDLIADRNVPAEQITRLTRSLFEDRQKMVAESALASFVKAASTDKDAAISVHPGAKIYYDGEEQTFVEKYGDWVYIGPIIFGALASAAMAVLRFLGVSGLRREPPLLAKVPEVIQAIDSARSTEELDSIRGRINAAVERVSMDAAEGRGSEQNMGAIAMAVAHLDRLLRDRYSQLTGSQNAPDSGDRG